MNGGAASDPPVDHDDDDGPIVYDANYFMCVFGESVFLSVVQNQIITFGGSAGVLVNSPVAVTELLTEQELAEFQAQALSFAATYGSPSPWAVDSDLATLFGSTMGSGGVTPEPEVTAPETPTRTKPTATTGDHTPTGGLLGSNGDVVFMADAAESEIFGAVRPGPDGSVTGLPESNVTGATEARAVAVPMDPVVVPDISSSGDLSVSGGIPTVLSTPEVGYGVVTVGPGEDLELRGPMTIIVTDLILESGARLTLDTTAGDVQLFVRRDVTLDPTSAIATATIPGFGASVQAAGDATGTSTLSLEATGEFHGTIYAPDSTVRLGPNFEVFGSVAAKRLEIAKGSRLHFDSETYDGSLPMPIIDTWRILSMPDAPVAALPVGSDPEATLSEAHDIGDVNLSIWYWVDGDIIPKHYEGPEADFDRSVVAHVLSEERYTTPGPARPTPDWLVEWVEGVREARAEHGDAGSASTAGL